MAAFSSFSCSSRVGKRPMRRRPVKASAIMNTMGMGSLSSLTKAAPTVKIFETNSIILIAVAFFSNGNICSS